MLNFFGSTTQLPKNINQNFPALYNESQIAINKLLIQKFKKMPTQIITTDDLREFKTELLDDIKKLLSTNASTTTKKYLKSAELMKLLQVSPGTLQTLRINGTLPYTKIGGIIFYDADEIHKVIKENSVHNTY